MMAIWVAIETILMMRRWVRHRISWLKEDKQRSSQTTFLSFICNSIRKPTINSKAQKPLLTIADCSRSVISWASIVASVTIECPFETGEWAIPFSKLFSTNFTILSSTSWSSLTSLSSRRLSPLGSLVSPSCSLSPISGTTSSKSPIFSDSVSPIDSSSSIWPISLVPTFVDSGATLQSTKA